MENKELNGISLEEQEETEAELQSVLITNPYLRLGILATAGTGFLALHVARESFKHQLMLEHPPRDTAASNYTPRFTNIFQAAKLIFKEEGLSGFFKGASAQLLSYLAYDVSDSIVQSFLPESIAETYDLVDNGAIDELYSMRERLKHIAVYEGVSCIPTLFTYPLLTIATKLQSQKPLYISNMELPSSEKLHLFSAAIQIGEEGGFSAFYRGYHLYLLAHLVRAFSTHILRSCIMSIIGETPEDDTISHLTSTRIAGVLAFPIDLVRLRLQSQDNTYTYGTIDCVKQIYKTEGIAGFFKGFWYYALKSIFGRD